MKTIFLTTVQFSGTRFLNYSIIDAIRPHFTRMQLANVKGFYRIADTIKDKLTHTNTNNIKELIVGVKKRLSKVDSNQMIGIITAHIGDSNKGFIPFADQEKLIGLFPTAVTLRDPLASLLTREGRRMDDHQQYLVDGYESLAKSKRTFFKLPVDLYADKPCKYRCELLKGLFSFLDISVGEKYIRKTASEWRVRENIQDDPSVSSFAKKRASQLKNWYRLGNIKEIFKVIPKCYEYLKSKESIIRPMLEEAGYTNLLWWG
jgi:hypothetical protein